MPAAFTNPTLNPLQSYLEFNQGKPNAEADYQAGVNKGYAWDGKGWTYKGGGDPAYWTEAMKKGAAAADDTARWGAGGAPMSGYSPGTMGPGGPGGGGGGGSGTTSLATGGSVGSGGGYKGDAQLAQIRDDFRRMTESGISGINEDLNQRGIFSSGVGGKISGDYRTQMGQQEASAIERLMNDIMGRNQASELAKQQFEWQKQLAMMGGGSQRFGSGDTGGNQNDDLMALFKQMMGGGGSQAPGGYSSKGDTFKDKFGGGMSGGAMGDLPKGTLPPGDTTGGINALADLKAQYNMMKSVNPAGAEALKAQIYALGGSV